MRNKMPLCWKYQNGAEHAEQIFLAHAQQNAPLLNGSALDSIHQNHLGREGLRWNDEQLMICYTKWKLRSYDNMPIYADDLSVLFVWEIASNIFTQEMVSINLLLDCIIIKKFMQFYPDISHI